MNTFILVLFIASSAYTSNTGQASAVVEFTPQQKCMAAGTALVADATLRGSRTITWGCFPK